MTVLVVGDVLLDRDLTGTVERVCPDAPVPVVQVGDDRSHAGGAGLAASLAAELSGQPVRLLTAVGSDPAGAEVTELLAEAGVDVVALPSTAATAEKIRVRAAGQSLVRIDRGAAAAAVVSWDPDTIHQAFEGVEAVLVSDYGRGLTSDPVVRAACLRAAEVVPVTWDPHPRGAEPVPGCRLVSPNLDEARRLASSADATSGHAASPIGEGADLAADLVRRWDAHAVAVTMGAAGAVIADRVGSATVVPAPYPADGDACGAGDCFAAAVAAGFADGLLPTEAVHGAVATATEYVGSDTVPTPPPDGSVTVSTSGCFDLLHAGHVHMLEAARRLGDRLVVLLNSDASVRRLKGRDRPLQRQADRAAVLRSLGCVDEVVTFDEDTPVAALHRLRPELFVKGGDYRTDELPEAAALRRWGGRAVTVGYLADRSTTRLVQEAARHVHR